MGEREKMREKKHKGKERETGDTLRSGGGKACSDDKSRPSFYFVTGQNAAAIICHRVCFKTKKKGLFLFLSFSDCCCCNW
jgi:hypothetical protein